MKYAEITDLLNRYWEGETSLEEEKLLQRYFNSGAVDPRLQSFAPLFQAIQAEQAVSFEGRPPMRVLYTPNRRLLRVAAAAVILGAGAWWMLHSPQKPLETQISNNQTWQRPDPATPSLVTEVNSPAPEKPKRTRAVFAHRRNKISAKERADAENAFLAVKAALALVSNKLNKGREEARKNLNHLEALDIIKKKKETTG